ncbi:MULTISPECIES: 5-(carboxyamino)imidazole ribonucleotide synthase [unclassified Thiomonas]|jgi:5-(carboxyamino)imidazole ribonucleotide synthase|uniref:5-(carboxyamino)imidazole ribonucleotide synthase n=1 Tax=unclassified Thiomonas TaxID=2625466 RepID=UPI0004DBB6F0|nr:MULTISPECIES: 5-(carboxyamino)imidazole ribonucleotide synthase [unclassified Thiomonas]MDE2176225.1 5-(carboxyamino)imidazole ribonucleotide synthase [Betaproteobacteria bacterium]OYV31316.1 MAG: 5-(carboxyamino)imidazole ribonucleotide synthase [Thiomonas sp. 20-64-9]OZB69948.1 MAG: 5-(carboxyamino)imidazole ribonucleotide synthase [Thiomonas sp. 13-64-67]CDW94607.1 N5-carboxyaminoimidazole ribonucleotide synthase [Thiomonas sp. CB2]VDY04246.1 N5-carboxyaminoimidazole ribonucleotide synth
MSKSAAFIPPGATLGVLGGGQLGRMFTQAAQSAGYGVAVLEADEAAPAAQVTGIHLAARYDDPLALDQLARDCAAVTVEFENIPAYSMQWLESRVPLAPAPQAVAVCQDRAQEKALFARLGVPCAPHAVLTASGGLGAVSTELFPGILKTSRLGYDGKGQIAVQTATDLPTAWTALGGVDCVLEKKLDLAYELSVVMARGRDGCSVLYEPQQNLHRDGILFASFSPGAPITPDIAEAAQNAAATVAEGLDYVGVLCVEFFVLRDGRLLANEIAPRPHNSGHHTIDSCTVSQFELQWRTLVNAPLLVPRQHSATVMLNLLGDLWFDATGQQREPDWATVLAQPGAHLHLYGKHAPRKGRKMGHLTCTAATPAEARQTALHACTVLGLEPF